MIETPTAILDVRSIAAHERVDGARDGHQRPRQGAARRAAARATPARARTWPTALLAAREAGKVILDGVYNDVKDADGFAAECRQGAEMGFDGKTLIHPSPGRAVQRRVGAERRTRSTTPGG